MAGRDDVGRVYLALSDVYATRGEAGMRDRFLVLAADAALAAGQPADADKLRRQLLQHSPHHLLKPYGSFAQAVEAPDLAAYIKDLRQSYPPETAGTLLASLRKEGVTARGNAPPRSPAQSGEPATRTPSPRMNPPLDATQPPPKAEPAIYKMRDVKDESAPSDVAATLPPNTRYADLAATLPPNSRHPDLAATLPPEGVRVPGASSAAKPTRPTKVEAGAAGRRKAERPAPVPGSSARPFAPYTSTPAAGVADDASRDGSWLAALLFGLVITAGVVWLAWTLARPFLST